MEKKSSFGGIFDRRKLPRVEEEKGKGTLKSGDSSLLEARDQIKIPEKGQPVWYRNMPFEIVEVGMKYPDTTFENEHYKVKCQTAELQWNEEFQFWFLPGTEGEMPKKVRGELVVPPRARCPRCKKPQLKPLHCAECRQKMSK